MTSTELTQARAHAHALLTELAALKSERDELRSYAQWLLADLKIMHPEMLQSLGAKRLQAILERTEPK